MQSGIRGSWKSELRLSIHHAISVAYLSDICHAQGSKPACTEATEENASKTDIVGRGHKFKCDGDKFEDQKE